MPLHFPQCIAEGLIGSLRLTELEMSPRNDQSGTSKVCPGSTGATLLHEPLLACVERDGWSVPLEGPSCRVDEKLSFRGRLECLCKQVRSFVSVPKTVESLDEMLSRRNGPRRKVALLVRWYATPSDELQRSGNEIGLELHRQRQVIQAAPASVGGLVPVR